MQEVPIKLKISLDYRFDSGNFMLGIHFPTLEDFTRGLSLVVSMVIPKQLAPISPHKKAGSRLVERIAMSTLGIKGCREFHFTNEIGSIFSPFLVDWKVELGKSSIFRDDPELMRVLLSPCRFSCPEWKQILKKYYNV